MPSTYPVSLSRCDCCGLPLYEQIGDDCPRCGYPVNVVKEEQFLEDVIHNLQRVMKYGGAMLTVTDLSRRYQLRLSMIHQQRIPPASVAQNIPATSSTVSPSFVGSHVGSQQPVPMQQQTPRQMFSLKSFLAEQTINIVASLGAFFILVGSLSFVVTTTNLLLSFLVVFLVHAAFAITGFVLNRFQSFQLVARIYIAIFALLVPLVGFAGYRLVLNQLIHIPIPLVVAIAATYAAIVYSVLAVYQQFRPFGYLAAVALVVADLSVAFALHLNGWWWPVCLMPLALAALVSIRRSGDRPFVGNLLILREPVRVAMIFCMLVLGLGIIGTLLYSFTLDTFRYLQSEPRFAIAVMLTLLLVWTVICLRLTRRSNTAYAVLYLLLADVLAFAYAFSLHQTGYILVLTTIALLYHCAARFASQFLQRFASLREHAQVIALLLVGIIPFVAAPLLPFQLFAKAYMVQGFSFYPTTEALVGFVAVGCGLIIVASTIEMHTGPRKRAGTITTRWQWLLLLGGFLLTWMYSMTVLFLPVSPVWSFFGLAFVFAGVSVAVRRFIGSSWANPLDVLTLCEVLLVILLSHAQSPDIILSLLLLFAALAYTVVLYQRRQQWLFLPLVFIVLALPLLIARPNSFWILALLAPVVATLAYGVSRLVGKVWSIPPYAVALLAAIMMGFVASQQGQLPNAIWTLLGFAALIYLIGMVENNLFFLWTAPCFATWSVYTAALLDNLYHPPVVALLCAAIGVGIGCLNYIPLFSLMQRNRLRSYALPFYGTALAAAVLTGIYGTLAGIDKPFLGAIPDALLLYALIAYGVLLFERQPEMLVIPVGFSVWAIAQTHWSFWQQVIAYSLLWVLVFVTQFLWRRRSPLPPLTTMLPPERLHTLLAISGQVMVILAVIGRGGLVAEAGLLAHTGAGALLVLAALVFWYGRMLPVQRRWCDYVAGLLLACVVSWTLSAFHQTRVDILTLVPATYLIVVAPFLLRDERVLQRHVMGRICSIAGAILLLLPTLWLSFSQSNLEPTLILAGEALILLLLGIVTRMRFLALSGTGLIVISVMHALFLPAFGIPTSLALTILGSTLLVLASALSLARHRLRVVWSQWE